LAQRLAPPRSRGAQLREISSAAAMLMTFSPAVGEQPDCNVPAARRHSRARFRGRSRGHEHHAMHRRRCTASHRVHAFPEGKRRRSPV